ncbi:MAG TPA: nucleoside triphosphate pyrophosphohydrolase family protein [Aggregatilinea sp.]|jgi:NTP pyrophosphatase (non-canonical NTP hydrolase)|uniref:nucleoside triphosphate pyrophosphohydrolase family protein n=1 Tax=Aggregatilinea sp. TaxID=2806333 RepID=UPI002BB3F0A4|nr:nucleoside triphosphate pyrophosphohydrolase family protein [Aggregatilinea sp.]HML24146.1 nucleoside triphosphate pyrophosphohydrolase family protein [Aggregatilinea sp.]
MTGVPADSGALTLREYQERAALTAKYPDAGHNPIYPTLGLAGEAGEVAEKVKKVLRDNGGQFDAAAVAAIRKELGDVLWYVARLAAELGLDLEDVAQANLDKLASRQARGVLHGSGDER